MVNDDLIEALETEMALFEKRKQDITDHKFAICYLKNGVSPLMPDEYIGDYPLLEAAMTDLKTLRSDYLN